MVSCSEPTLEGQSSRKIPPYIAPYGRTLFIMNCTACDRYVSDSSTDPYPLNTMLWPSFPYSGQVGSPVPMIFDGYHISRTFMAAFVLYH